jgi:hypothetical protein
MLASLDVAIIIFPRRSSCENLLDMCPNRLGMNISTGRYRILGLNIETWVSNRNFLRIILISVRKGRYGVALHVALISC